ncbi:MAG: TIGR02206 family membrane protein, partial [Verrucomicrobiota bacterium]
MLANPSPFRLFGADHLVVLALTFVIPLLLGLGARKYGPDSAWTRRVNVFFVILLLTSFPLKLIVGWAIGLFPDMSNRLPMHLCNWAAIAGVFAFWKNGSPLAKELLYFWGLAGTLQAVLTPELPYGFPHPGFLVFFGLHSGIVAAALY